MLASSFVFFCWFYHNAAGVLDACTAPGRWKVSPTHQCAGGVSGRRCVQCCRIPCQQEDARGQPVADCRSAWGHRSCTVQSEPVGPLVMDRLHAPLRTDFLWQMTLNARGASNVACGVGRVVPHAAPPPGGDQVQAAVRLMSIPVNTVVCAAQCLFACAHTSPEQPSFGGYYEPVVRSRLHCLPPPNYGARTHSVSVRSPTTPARRG